VVAEGDAPGAQVAPPARDPAELDGEAQLRVHVVERARRLVRFGVVDHDADGAVGNAARAVLHLPLRVDPARLAVGVDDAIALRVAAGAARRFRIDAGGAVVDMDAIDRLAVVRRAVGRVEPPELEHVLVPAALARRDVAFPDAEPAELLRGLEQLVLARGACGKPARQRDVGEHPEDDVAGDAHAACVGPHRLAVGAAQLERAALAFACAQHASERQPRFGACRALQREVEQRRVRPTVVAGRRREPAVDPEQLPAHVGHREQLAALGEERLEQLRRQRCRARIVRSVAHRPSAAPALAAGSPRTALRSLARRDAAGPAAQRSATCRMSLPKFSPRKSLSSVSGKVSKPTTMSSRLVMRPSLRYDASSVIAAGNRST